MEFEAWRVKVPESLKKDPIWDFAAYPKALFLSDLAWNDCAKLLNDVRGQGDRPAARSQRRIDQRKHR
jgi:hypothetical protein